MGTSVRMILAYFARCGATIGTMRKRVSGGSFLMRAASAVSLLQPLGEWVFLGAKLCGDELRDLKRALFVEMGVILTAFGQVGVFAGFYPDEERLGVLRTEFFEQGASELM